MPVYPLLAVPSPLPRCLYISIFVLSRHVVFHVVVHVVVHVVYRRLSSFIVVVASLRWCLGRRSGAGGGGGGGGGDEHVRRIPTAPHTGSPDNVHRRIDAHARCFGRASCTWRKRGGRGEREIEKRRSRRREERSRRDRGEIDLIRFTTHSVISQTTHVATHTHTAHTIHARAAIA